MKPKRHQPAGLCVSSSPSKIPYGGFSPVRLQTESPSQPSSTRREPRRLIGDASPGLGNELKSVVGLASKRHSSRLTATLPSRGPWLPSELCCLAGSSLTMTSSEALVRSGAAYVFPVRYNPEREIPQFTLPICFSVPSSVPRQIGRLHLAMAWSSVRPSPSSYWVGICKPRLSGLRVDRVTRLQSSLHATARRIASLAPAKAFTFELAPQESPPRGVEYNYAGHSHFPRPDFHRLDKQPYGLRTKVTKAN